MTENSPHLNLYYNNGPCNLIGSEKILFFIGNLGGDESMKDCGRQLAHKLKFHRSFTAFMRNIPRIACAYV